MGLFYTLKLAATLFLSLAFEEGEVWGQETLILCGDGREGEGGFCRIGRYVWPGVSG